MTAAELKTLIDQLFPDNNTGEISEADLREVTKALADLAGAPEFDNLGIEWKVDVTYNTDDLVTQLDRIWKSKQDNNLANQPPTNTSISENDWWVEQSQSAGTPIAEWSPGVYGEGLVIVFWENVFYKLENPSRPFLSTNIVTEAANGDWIPVSGGESFADAPGDGTAYGRKDGAWTEVLEGLEDGSGTKYSPWDKAVDLGVKLKKPGIIAGDIATLGNEFLDFGSGFNGTVEDIKIDEFGRIYVCGGFTTYKGESATYICRLLRDGTLDPDFNIGTFVTVTNVLEIHFLEDGRILWAGRFREYDGHSAVGLVVTDIDGNVDTSFTSSISNSFNGNPAISAAVQSDGKIVAVGRITQVNGSTTVPNIVRLNADGSTDSGFLANVGTGPSDIPWIVRVDDDDKIYIGGQFIIYDGEADHRGLIRLNSNGTIDSGFNIDDGFRNSTDTNHDVWEIQIQKDGKVVCGGDFRTFNGVTVNGIIRLNEDGTRDTSFDVGTGMVGQSCYALKLLHDGKIIIGGNSNNYNGATVGSVFIVDKNGVLQRTFRAFPGTFCYAIEQDITGKVIAGGSFTSVTTRDKNNNATGSYTANRIVVFMPDGSPDSEDYNSEYVNLIGKKGNILHTKTRYLTEPDELDDLDVVYLKKVEELINDVAPSTPTTKRVQLTVTDGATPEINADSGTEVYAKWEAGTAATAPVLSNVVANSVLQLNIKKTGSANVEITFNQSGYRFALEKEEAAASKAVVLSGPENAFFSVSLNVTAHEISGDKVITIVSG